jgi:hypothetical protein
VSRLLVIAVPPEHSYPREPDGLYQVFLGDCVLPGHLLGKYGTREEANAAAFSFAGHYDLRPMLIRPSKDDGPHLRLIQGGADLNGRAAPEGNAP